MCMKKEYKFIRTKDKDSADKMIAMNYKLICYDSSGWTFLINKRQNFDTSVLKNIVFTNELYI
mgnify:CR=1 FL=1